MKFRSHQIRLCIFFTFEIVFWIRIIMNYTLLVEFEITHIQKYPRRICRSAILKYGRIHNRNWNRRIIFIVLFYRPLYEEFNPRREKNKNSERSWWASIPRKISRVSKSNWRSTRWAGVLASKNLLLHSSRGRTFGQPFILLQPLLPSFCTMLRIPIFSKSVCPSTRLDVDLCLRAKFKSCII